MDCAFACRPLPAAAGLSSSSRACDRPALPSPVWGRAGLASCGCRPPASVGRWRPRGGAARGELCACGGRGGRRCAAGERSPWPACGSRVCVSVAVGVSPREGAGGGAPVRRPGRAVGPSLCWEASGGEIPRWALAADSRFPLPQHGSL